MLELGGRAAEFHGRLVEPIVSHAIDLVFCAGPLMRALWEKLPPERRGGYAKTSIALEADVLATVRGGDVIMVKGSLGSRMGPIVKALARRFPNQEAAAPAAAQG